MQILLRVKFDDTDKASNQCFLCVINFSINRFFLGRDKEVIERLHLFSLFSFARRPLRQRGQLRENAGQKSKSAHTQAVGGSYVKKA